MNEQIERKGILISISPGEEAGQPLVVLSTNLEECFVIDRIGKGAELDCHLRKAVSITGSIRLNEKGTRVLLVQDYELLDSLP